MVTSTGNDLAGRVLADRYRLLVPIGTGASGRVYAAEDIRLRRRVAVKVLHSALAEDAGFLRRFRAEAQVAASLHHPNIMAVYDWGEDEQPFMVVELLEGGSLRAMLDRGNLLTISQAARLGRDVAGALDYAPRGIVHRDVKPANLLFDDDGRLRIADFGLARAIAEAAWTEPAERVFGTARCVIPEQARGVQLGSDLYSLALVLVEAVTGHIPFAADTTLGTLAGGGTQQPIVAHPRWDRCRRSSSAPARSIPTTAIPTRRRWKPRSPTWWRPCRNRNRSCCRRLRRGRSTSHPGGRRPHHLPLFDQGRAADGPIDFVPIGAAHDPPPTRFAAPHRTKRLRQRRLVPLAVLAVRRRHRARHLGALAQVEATDHRARSRRDSHKPGRSQAAKERPVDPCG